LGGPLGIPRAARKASKRFIFFFLPFLLVGFVFFLSSFFVGVVVFFFVGVVVFFFVVFFLVGGRLREALVVFL
jgi:hypothetical protein